MKLEEIKLVYNNLLDKTNNIYILISNITDLDSKNRIELSNIEGTLTKWNHNHIIYWRIDNIQKLQGYMSAILTDTIVLTINNLFSLFSRLVQYNKISKDFEQKLVNLFSGVYDDVLYLVDFVLNYNHILKACINSNVDIMKEKLVIAKEKYNITSNFNSLFTTVEKISFNMV